MRKQRKEKGTNSPQRIRRFVWTAVFLAVVACGATAAISLTGQAKNPQIKSGSEALQNNPRPQVPLRSLAQSMPVDAQTGLIRPLTQEEAQIMANGIKQMVNQSTDGLKAVKHADGSVSMDLGGHFQNVILARKTDDGQVAQSCVDNPKSAAEFLGIDPQLVGVPRSDVPSRTDGPAVQKGQDQ
ncbi:MAG: post-PEP-CTERM-1 domain-containing protein [Pyrinomonadaceae bacterium]